MGDGQCATQLLQLPSLMSPSRSPSLSPTFLQSTPLSPVHPATSILFAPAPGPNAAAMNDEIHALLFMIQVRAVAHNGQRRRGKLCSLGQNDAHLSRRFASFPCLLPFPVCLQRELLAFCPALEVPPSEMVPTAEQADAE